MEGKYKDFRFRPLLRREIEEAQRNTKSNNEAARFLGVGIYRYRAWAKYYGLWDQHNNKFGLGIKKPRIHGNGAHSLQLVFANTYPNYNMNTLKKRLILTGLMVEECNLCGFKEARTFDGRVPLLLHKKEGKSFAFDNLELRCYNCTFLTTGTLGQYGVVHSEPTPSGIRTIHQDFEEVRSDELSPEELEALQNDIRNEVT